MNIFMQSAILAPIVLLITHAKIYSLIKLYNNFRVWCSAGYEERGDYWLAGFFVFCLVVAVYAICLIPGAWLFWLFWFIIIRSGFIQTALRFLKNIEKK